MSSKMAKFRLLCRRTCSTSKAGVQQLSVAENSYNIDNSGLLIEITFPSATFEVACFEAQHPPTAAERTLHEPKSQTRQPDPYTLLPYPKDFHPINSASTNS